MRNILICASVLGFSGLARAENIVKSFDAKAVTKVEIKNETGDISIKGTDKAEIQLNAVLDPWHKDCSLKTEIDGNTLHIATKAPKPRFSANCKAKIELVIPKSIKLALNNGAGDIALQNFAGDLEFNIGSGDFNGTKLTANEISGKSGSGDIKFEGDIKEADLQVGSGDVSLVGAIDDGEIKLGSGDVDLNLNRVPKEGSIEVKSGMGDTLIKIPGQAKVNSDLKTGIGEVTNELGSDVASEFDIAVKSGIGDIKIQKM